MNNLEATAKAMLKQAGKRLSFEAFDIRRELRPWERVAKRLRVFDCLVRWGFVEPETKLTWDIKEGEHTIRIGRPQTFTLPPNPAVGDVYRVHTNDGSMHVSRGGGPFVRLEDGEELP